MVIEKSESIYLFKKMLAFYFTNMFNAKLSIDNEVNFMLKHSLTPNELFLLRTIFLAQED